MPNARRSYPRPYNYRHPNARRSRAGCFNRSDGTCQGCGKDHAHEAHHWTYPTEEDTTANHLTAFCRYCHDLITWFAWFISSGGSRELLCELFPTFLARLLDRPDRSESKRVGRARRVEGAWGALVSGMARPCPGEVIEILLRCSGRWRDFVIVGVVDGRPGSWRVLTRPLHQHDQVRSICVDAQVPRRDPRLGATPPVRESFGPRHFGSERDGR